MDSPVAYFITFTTYGNWLHGRAPGSVDSEHNEPGTPWLPANPIEEQTNRTSMVQRSYKLDAPKRDLVLKTIREVAEHRRWRLWAVHVRSTHVHVIVTAPDKPEKVLADFKAWCSRRLREQFDEPADRKRWAEHGSTKYAWRRDQLEALIDYVVNRQGEPMAVYQNISEPEA